MLFDNRRFTFDRVIRLAIIIFFLWAGIRLLSYLSDALIPFAIAILLAYLIHPLVVLIQKRIKNRPAAVLITLVFLVLAIIVVSSILIPVIAGEFAAMGPMLSKLASSKLADQIAGRFPSGLWQEIKTYVASDEAQDFFRTERFWEILETASKKVLPGVWGVISGVTSLIFGLIGLTVVLLYLFFLLLDYDKLLSHWDEILPPRYRSSAISFVTDFNDGMKRYFRGQAMIAFTVGVLFALGYWLIGLPMGVLLGLFTGLLNMVPYLQIVGLIPAFLLALLYGVVEGSSVWGMVLMVGIVFAVVQTIQDAVLTPKIMGKVTGLSPAIILLSLSIWGKLLGFFGLLIALPMTCLLWAYYRRLILPAEGERNEGRDVSIVQ